MGCATYVVALTSGALAVGRENTARGRACPVDHWGGTRCVRSGRDSRRSAVSYILRSRVGIIGSSRLSSCSGASPLPTMRYLVCCWGGAYAGGVCCLSCFPTSRKARQKTVTIKLLCTLLTAGEEGGTTWHNSRNPRAFKAYYLP